MSIWRNQRYRSFENQAQQGDMLRGVPDQPFPWILRTATASDAQGDEWTFEILCNSIESAKIGTQIEAEFTAVARCHIRPERISELGFSLERLDWLGIEPSDLIEDSLNARVKLKMDLLEVYATRFLEKIKSQVLADATNREKFRRIKDAIDSRPLSRFSHNHTAENETRR